MIVNKPVCFSASKIGSLLAGGTGKTRMNYIFELGLKSIGIETKLSTSAMEHGINNEFYALKIAEDKLGCVPNIDGEGNQVFFPINETVGATPDAIGEGFVLDSKCQYYIHTYFEQCDKLTLGYKLQLQTQMMALNVDRGVLMNYLTKPDVWGQDDWKEYPFPLEERYFFHEIEAEPEIQDTILMESAKWFPMIGECADILLNAVEIEEDEFFYMQFISKKRFKKLKDVDWLKQNLVYRFIDDFYV